MRKLTEYSDNGQASLLKNKLSQEGIESDLRAEAEVTAVWILDEDDFLDAQRILNGERPLQKRSIAARSMSSVSPAFKRYRAPRNLNLTLYIIIASVILTFGLDLPGMADLKMKFFFSEWSGRSFPEIRSGELWRLFTPALLHGGMFHLLFNMLWLYQFGSQIEDQQGSWALAGLMLILALFCHIAQYMVSGAGFLGMSGVIYGLLGYIWMMSEHDRKYRYALDPMSLWIMVGWLLVCLTGLVGPVANTQHIVGLVSGTAWGAWRSGFLLSKMRMR